MGAAEWSRVAELFERAVALPEGERTRFLEGACEDDPALLASVSDLLGADAGASALLDATPEELAEAVATSPEPATEGWRVGPYRLVRELGRGGMGVVYLARREDLRNTVALKLIRQFPAAPELGARFRREQAVHAQLEHPHIARLLDAGVADDGTPWLAMEYVDGSSIDGHCDGRLLTIAERLELFEKVGQAVAHAHRNLVVHRDLKPSNILVTPAGEPKLVDFGIAKLLAPEIVGLHHTHTAGGALTLAFASPEQLRAGPITTATDVYQLGLLLHELLTGLPATGAEGRPLDPAARMAEQEPARPSTVTGLTPAPAEGQRVLSPVARAALRRTTPERLRRALQGDLDTIILKALRPNPADRYASAEQLVEDVRRYRDGLPVQARPGALSYRVGKLIRRHRVTSALLATLLLLLLAGATALGVQHRRVARERDRTDQFSRLLEGLIYGADPLGTGDSLTARSVLDRTVRQARARVADEPEVWGRLMVVVGKAYQNMGHLDEAIAVQQEALEALRAAGAGESPLIIDALRSLGLARVRANDFPGGVARLEEAVDLSIRRGEGGRGGLGASLADLGNARDFMGELDSAEALYRGAMTVLASLPDSGGGQFDQLRVNLGNLVLQGGRLVEAEALLSGAVLRLSTREGPESGATLAAKVELADVLLKLGRLTEAERIATEVLATRRRLNRAPHEQLANSLLQHGRSMAENGKWAEAERSVSEAVDVWRTLNGQESYSVAYAQVQLADVLKRAGKVDRAIDLERSSLARYIRLGGSQSTGAVYTATRLAHSEHLRGWLDSAEHRFREVLPRLDSTPSGQGRLVRPFTDFAALLAERGKCAEAEPYLRRAMAIAEQGWGLAHPASLRPRRLLGGCLARSRRYETAEAVLLPAYRRARDAGEYAPRLTSEMAGALIELYELWGRSDRAGPFRTVAGERLAQKSTGRR